MEFWASVDEAEAAIKAEQEAADRANADAAAKNAATNDRATDALMAHELRMARLTGRASIFSDN